MKKRILHYSLLFALLAGNTVFAGKLNKPIGFVNRGATCYMNSVLQCILRINPLARFIMKADGIYNDNTMSSEFNKLIKLIPNSSGSALKISDEFCQLIFKSLGLPQDSYSSQQDASEFLSNLVNGLSDTDMKLDKKGSEKYNTVDKTAKNEVSKIFGIIKNSELQTGDKSQYFTNKLELPINSNQKLTLKDCLDKYFAWEDIILNDKSNKKRFTLKETGEYVIMNLKRFNYSNNKIDKVYTPVSFDLDDLDLNPYFDQNEMSDEQKKNNYELIGFIAHSGTGSAGHYMSYIKFNDGKWYLCNDDDISLMDDKVIKYISQKGEDKINNHMVKTGIDYLLKNNYENFVKYTDDIVNDIEEIDTFTPYIFIYKKKDNTNTISATNQVNSSNGDENKNENKKRKTNHNDMDINMNDFDFDLARKIEEFEKNSKKEEDQKNQVILSAIMNMEELPFELIIYMVLHNADNNLIKRKIMNHKNVFELINSQDKTGVSLLHAAVLTKNRDLVEFLLDQGANIEAKDGLRGATPLILAISEYQDEYLVKLLLSRKANPNALDNKGYSPAYYAVLKNNTGILKLLTITPGFEINQRTIDGKDTLVSKALQDAKMEQMSQLINMANIFKSEFKNPLHDAIKKQDAKKVRELLQKGSKVDDETMEIALKVDNPEITGMLFEYSSGGNPNITEIH